MVFLGTPEFAVPSLRAVAAACDLVGVVTRPDRPRGRGRVVAESAVARAARELGVEAMKPVDPNDEQTRAALAKLEAVLFAVVAFGAILSRPMLAVPRLGCVNLHGSLLPEYRGASPVQHALWDGRSATGVTTLWMDEGIDTGDLILQRWEPIHPEDDAGTLAARLARDGAPLLAESLTLAARGEAPRIPQERAGSGALAPGDREGAKAAGRYAARLSKRDGLVRWDQDVGTVWNHQRAVTPWPGAATAWQGRPLLLTRARPLHRLPVAEPPGTILGIGEEGVTVACRPGALLVARVKPEGRAEMDSAAWARGARPVPGQRLGAPAAVGA